MGTLRRRALKRVPAAATSPGGVSAAVTHHFRKCFPLFPVWRRSRRGAGWFARGAGCEHPGAGKSVRPPLCGLIRIRLSRVALAAAAGATVPKLSSQPPPEKFLLNRRYFFQAWVTPRKGQGHCCQGVYIPVEVRKRKQNIRDKADSDRSIKKTKLGDICT